MEDRKRLNQEKSAMLTALLSALDTCHCICSNIERRDAFTANTGFSVEDIKEKIEHLEDVVDALRSAVDEAS